MIQGFEFSFWKLGSFHEVFLFDMEILQSMGVKHVEVVGDSLLVVQQVSKVCQCYNSTLNAYLDKCLDIISSFDEFVIRHLQREENGQATLWLKKHLVIKLKRKKIQH